MVRLKYNRHFFIFSIVLLLSIFIFYLVFFSKYQQQKISQPSSSNTKEMVPTTSFLVFGDSGSGDSKQKELAEIMLEFPFEFILHTGDLAYPDGSKQQLQNKFFSIYKAHLARGPVYPAPGNHDYLTNNLTPYLSMFDLPKQAFRKRDDERYYSFDIQNIHFIALDTNTPLYEISDKQTDDMADWLENDLEKSLNANWKIVYFHHPSYSSGKEHGGNFRVKKILVPILEKYGVDVVFSGHEHNYERTCKMSNDICSQKGIIFVVTGGGGGPLYDFGEEQIFTASRSSQYHFVRSVISQCKLDVEVISIDRKLIDTFSLEKCNL